MKFNKIFWIELTDHVVDYVFWPNKKNLRDFEQTQSLLVAIPIPPVDILYFSLEIECKPWPEKAKTPQEIDYEWKLKWITGEQGKDDVVLEKETVKQLEIFLSDEIDATVYDEIGGNL